MVVNRSIHTASAQCSFCRNFVSEHELSPVLGARFLARLRAIELPCHDVHDLERAIATVAPGEVRLCLDHIVGFEDARGGSITVRALLSAEAACEHAGGAAAELDDPRAGLVGPSNCGQCGRVAAGEELDYHAGFCATCAGSRS